MVVYGKPGVCSPISSKWVLERERVITIIIIIIIIIIVVVVILVLWHLAYSC